MRTDKITGFVCVGLVVALFVLAGVVRAATVVGAAGTGTTEITPSSCSADVNGVIPSVLDVNNGDTVRVYFNVSWSDTRSSGPLATHFFNMTVAYSRASGDVWQLRTVQTPGTPSGSESLHIDVVVTPPATIGLSWLARLTSTACSPNPVEDSASGTISII